MSWSATWKRTRKPSSRDDCSAATSGCLWAEARRTGTMNPLRYPYRFGFSIVDDTDLARLETVKPVYDLLAELGVRTTKTVWPLRRDNPGNPSSEAHTLEDARYAEWIRSLSQEGFEIAFHGASGESNPRLKTIRALDRFAKVVGHLPSMYINHDGNRDNLYWGVARFDLLAVRAALLSAKGRSRRSFTGHSAGSEFFWGDLCREHIRYSRNMTFSGVINLRTVNPTMPYRDERRPFVKRWFSSCDASTPQCFVDLLSTRNLERLQDERGICILYTHFGDGFSNGGEVIEPVASALRHVASLPGRFVPATQLLDEICDPGGGTEAPLLPSPERMRMEYTWLYQRLRERRSS